METDTYELSQGRNEEGRYSNGETIERHDENNLVYNLLSLIAPESFFV